MDTVFHQIHFAMERSSEEDKNIHPFRSIVSNLLKQGLSSHLSRQVLLIHTVFQLFSKSKFTVEHQLRLWRSEFAGIGWELEKISKSFLIRPIALVDRSYHTIRSKSKSIKDPSDLKASVVI